MNARAVASPCGKSIALFTEDGNGAPTGVTSVPSADEVQAVQFVGTPSGSTIEPLTFEGQSTPPFAITTSPPQTFMLWTFPTISGHVYDLSTNFFTSNGPLGTLMYFETIVGGQIVAVWQRTGPSTTEFTDTDVFDGVGGSDTAHLADWTPATPSGGVTATASTMELRVTADLGYRQSGLRVHDRTAGTIAYYDITQSAHFSFTTPTNGLIILQAASAYSGQEYLCFIGSGVGQVTVIDPGGSTAAMVLQDALCALSTIGPGGVTVIDKSGTGRGNYQVTFAGGLAASSQPLITCSDPDIAISEIAQGGLGVELVLNGGSPILLTDRAWADTTDPTGQLDYVFIPLPQSAPDVQTFKAGEIPFSQSSGWDGTPYADPNSLSAFSVYGWSAAQTAGWTFVEMPPGTYRVGVTYPHAPFVAHHGGSDVTYQPSSATQFLVQDALGNTLGTYSVDQSSAPASYTSDGRGWHTLGSFTTTRGMTGLSVVMTTSGQSLAMSGTQNVAIIDGVQLTRTSSDASVIIGPDDVATVNIPANFITTQAGVIPAVSGLTVAPPTRYAFLPPFVDGPKSMKCGQNITVVDYGSEFVVHSNLATNLSSVGGLGVVYDAAGNLTRFVNAGHNPSFPGSATAIISVPPSTTAFGDPAQGQFYVNKGLFLLKWDGATDLTILPTGTTATSVTAVEQAGSVITGGAGNRRVYLVDWDDRQTARPGLRLIIQSTDHDPADSSGDTFIVDATNIKIYPPDPADVTGMTIWEHPPKFHPWYIAKYDGMAVVRNMDVHNINSNPYSLISQIKPESHASRWAYNVAVPPASIASIRWPDAPYFQNFGGPQLHVTTTAPHGFFDGCIANFVDAGTAVFADSGTILLSNAAGGPVHVIDDLNLIVCVFQAETTAMTNTLTGGGTLVAPVAGTHWSLQDIVDLVDAVPTVTDVHFNFPATIDTDDPNGAYAIAAFYAANLRAGVRFHAEFGNECWNESFQTHSWCALMESILNGVPDGFRYEKYFANRTKALHNECLAAFTAAGRAADFVHLYATFTGQPAITAKILDQARTNSAIVDEMAVAVYWTPAPSVAYISSNQMKTHDRMTVDQILDYAELNAVHGGFAANLVANQTPVLEQYGYGGAKLIAYEGSPSFMVGVDPANLANPHLLTPNYFSRQNAARRHPRMYWIQLQHSQAFQDAGLTMWSFYYIGGGNSDYCWGMWEAGNQPFGTGDETADAINITHPESTGTGYCELGGAWRHFANLYAAGSGPVAISGRQSIVRSIARRRPSLRVRVA